MTEAEEVATQKCITCGEVKPLTAFCRDKGYRSGYKRLCLDCSTRYQREWCRRNLKRIRLQRRRHRRLNPEQYRKQWQRDRRKPGYKQKHAARLTAYWAVQAGLLPRKYNCEKCGIDARHARLAKHHVDYYDPLNIVWLCGPCHGKAHQKQLD
jgi:hypothetical protein